MHIFPALITTAFFLVYVWFGLGSAPAQYLQALRRSLEHIPRHTPRHIPEHNLDPHRFKLYLCTIFSTGYPQFLSCLSHEMQVNPIQTMRTVCRQPLAPRRLFLFGCIIFCSVMFYSTIRSFRVLKPQQTINCRATPFLPEVEKSLRFDQFFPAAGQLRPAHAQGGSQAGRRHGKFHRPACFVIYRHQQVPQRLSVRR